MACTKIYITLLLSLLACGALASRMELSPRERWKRYRESQQCFLRRISTSRPSHRITSDGGVLELWNPDEEQFNCAGVAPMRFIVQPNSLALPKFFPAPRLIFVQQGQGYLGLSNPGCPESYHTQRQFSGGQQGQGHLRGDQHQRIHRIRRGDIIAIPAGVAHWCYNDANEELITVSVLDLNSDENQLDQNIRAFMLAGGQSWQSQQWQGRESPRRIHETFQNIFRSFDSELLAEAFNVPTNIVRRMQEDSYRGVIVRCRERMTFVAPDEEELGEYYPTVNGLEEAFCSMKIKLNIDIREKADVHTRQAGRINVCNEQKLPILRFLDMSAERGQLMPSALYTPHWSMTDHRVVYALRGEMHVQITDDMGNTIMNERVKEGDMFVIPQFYASISRAGQNGFEYVTFKTNSQPMKNTMAGYTSATRAMPIEVLTNAYMCSPREAQQLKMNRDPQSMLLSPTRGSAYSP